MDELHEVVEAAAGRGQFPERESGERARRDRPARDMAMRAADPDIRRLMALSPLFLRRYIKHGILHCDQAPCLPLAWAAAVSRVSQIGRNVPKVNTASGIVARLSKCLVRVS